MIIMIKRNPCLRLGPLGLGLIPTVKTSTHIHNYEHEQASMVTDLHRRPVISFLYLGVEAGGVYMWAIEQRLGTPILQQGELPSCPGESLYAAAQVYPL